MSKERMKRCSKSLITREKYIKTTRYHHIHILEWLLLKKQKITHIDKDVKKLQRLSTVGRNVKQYSLCRKQDARSSKTLKMKWTYYTTVLLLCIYPKELKAVLQRCISMFIALLFAIAKGGSNLSVHQQISGLIQYGIYRQWNITQP